MSNIKRSTFQKLAEENKRLKRDIELLVMEFDKETFCKWRKEFQMEQSFKFALKEAVIRWSREHPKSYWI